MKKRFKLIKYLLGFLIILGSILYVAPYFWNLEGYRNQIVAIIKNTTGQNVVIRGDITASLLPIPEIKIANLFLSDPNFDGEGENSVVSIKMLVARLNVIKLLSGNTEISAIKLVRPTATWQNIRSIRNNWNSAESKAEGVPLTAKDEVLVATSIENGKLYFGDSRKRSTAKIENINANINAESIAGPFILDGDFIINNNKFSFDADISTTDTMGEGGSTWNFVGDGFKVTFIGDLVGGEGEAKNTLSGTLKASSDDFDYIIAKYFQQKNVKRPENKDEDKQTAANPFLAEGKFSYSGKVLKIENFAISSDYISGQGDIKISTALDIPEVDTSLIFENINIDKFINNSFAGQQVSEVASDGTMTAESFIAQSEKTEDLYERVSRIIGGIAKEFNMISDISIKKLVYNNQPIEKIIFNADVFSGDFVINEFTAVLPGNSYLEVLGAIKHNAIRPRFSGEFSLAGDSLRTLTNWLGFSVEGAPEDVLGKYKLNGDLVLLPQKINLSGLDLGVDKTRASGSIIIRYGDKSPKIISNLQIGHLDLDSYKLSQPLANLIKTYYQGDPNNPITRNFNWLRSLRGHFGGELTLEDFTFNNITYKEISSLFSVSPGLLRIEKLDVDSNSVQLSSSVLFDITSIRPKVDLQVNAEKLDTLAFKELGQATEAAAEPTSSEGRATKAIWSDDPFYFFGLEQFDGKLNIRAKSFTHKLLGLENLAFEARLYEGTMAIDTLTANYTTGNINVKGVLGIEDTPNIAVSFALNNIELEKFLAVFSDIKTISGYGSFSGSVVTFGKSYLEWIKNAKSNIGAVGRAVKVSSLGLHDLIEKSEDLTIVKQLNDLAATAATTGSTLFDTVEVKFQTNNGMLDFTAMQLSTSRTTGVMSGRIDLVNWLMNLVGQFAYITLDNEATINLVFNAVGSVSDPKKSFNIDELLKHKGIAVAPKK